MVKLGYINISQNPKDNQWNGAIRRLQNQKTSRHKSPLEKIMVTIFSDAQGVILVDFLPREKTINSEA